MISDVPAALSALSEIVRRLKALKEWQKLEQQEARPDIPPSFRIMTDTDEDLRFQYGLFLSKASELRRILGNSIPSLSDDDRSRLRRELHHLEEQVGLLGLGERFISA